MDNIIGIKLYALNINTIKKNFRKNHIFSIFHFKIRFDGQRQKWSYTKNDYCNIDKNFKKKVLIINPKL